MVGKSATDFSVFERNADRIGWGYPMQQIERYMKGKLNQKEFDVLWIGLLFSPEWYEYFEKELHLTALTRSQNNPVRK